MVEGIMQAVVVALVRVLVVLVLALVVVLEAIKETVRAIGGSPGNQQHFQIPAFIAIRDGTPTSQTRLKSGCCSCPSLANRGRRSRPRQ